MTRVVCQTLPTQSWKASLSAVAKVPPLTTVLSFLFTWVTWASERLENWLATRGSSKETRVSCGGVILARGVRGY